MNKKKEYLILLELTKNSLNSCFNDIISTTINFFTCDKKML